MLLRDHFARVSLASRALAAEARHGPGLAGDLDVAAQADELARTASLTITISPLRDKDATHEM